MLFLKNGYPEYLIDRIHILKKEKFPTVKTKHLRLVLPDLGNISLQTRTKLQKSIKGVNYRLISKVQKKHNNFRFKNPFHQIPTSGGLTSFSADYAMNSIAENVSVLLL